MTSATVMDAPQEGSHRYPYFLPDGRHFLYTISGSPDRTGVYVGSLDGTTKKRLIPKTTSAVYAPPGYLLFVDGDTLLGQAFDADRLEVNGQPFLVGRNMSGVPAPSRPQSPCRAPMPWPLRTPSPHRAC